MAAGAGAVTEEVNGYTVGPRIGSEGGKSEARRPALPTKKEAPPSTQPRTADLPRSASYTYIGDAKHAAPYTSSPVVTIKGSFSEVDLIAPATDLADDSSPNSSGWTTPDEYDTVPVDQAADLIAELQKSPKIGVQRMMPASGSERSSLDSSVRPPSTTSTSVGSGRTASTQATTPGSVTSRPKESSSRRWSRNPWHGSSATSSPSRSPSPKKKEKKVWPHEIGTDGAVAPPPLSSTSLPDLLRRKSLGSRRDSAKQVNGNAAPDQKDDPVRPRTPSRRSTLLRRKSRPGSFFGGTKNDEVSRTPTVPDVPAVPRIPLLPKSFSTDKLPGFRSESPRPDRAAPMPRLLSGERVPTAGLSVPIRKRDELWNVFRNLDGDYTKFASKSVALKANVVRSSLLPFLRTYATHSSNRTLRPEDLDRRVNILNKWWTGMIEMLHGRNNQSISGTDRPAILDGISGIMERPEFRLPPSPFCPLDQRMKSMHMLQNRSDTSLSPGTSEFLTESVHHNVRNIFIENLSAQMAFVVDKMSLRNASASLVTFCGKACAYAFMFVPGMADVLVRLWDVQVDTLRRVLDNNGIGKFEKLDDLASTVVSGFPPALHQLAFSSLMKYVRKLRTPPPLPLGTANIQWWGRWLDRWTGRDSDLFYVFVKHFHILTTEFLPLHSTRPVRMCSPGMLLVHAQILVNLDATVHRAAAQADSAAVGASPTFDDVLSDPDAVASALPLPPTNAVRIMAENRLIMLIRDFLSERTSEHPVARDLFAESFHDLMQAAAKGISVFNHAACYTLLDFLEEALVILNRFENLRNSEIKLINSEFWQAVCKRMISSHNTMTEIRLYAFLYTVWNTVVCDLGRKANLCLNMLLDEEIFESRFNHWCPMVRAYYMRLICWRVGRFDGEAQPGDDKILQALQQRLQKTWSHYLWLRDDATRTHGLLPPTNPCNPAPGRRLVIIRTDATVAPGVSFLSFDGVVSPSPTSPSQPQAQQFPLKRFSTLSQVVELDSRPEPAHASSDSEMSGHSGKGIGGLFRKLMGKRSKSQGPPRRPSTTHSTRSAPELDHVLPAASEDPQIPRHRAALSEPLSQPRQPAQNAHRNFSFKFSLDFHTNSKPVPGPMRLYPPRLPRPAENFLREQAYSDDLLENVPVEPTGESRSHARYCGRALAEWTIVVGENQSFFERRKNEGVPNNKSVETPMLGVEVFRRPS